MTNATKKDIKLELLLSTMNRSSLNFLIDLFPESHYSNYNILIINQTTEANILESNNKSIRVINSYETGLANSRNLSISNAIGDLCLFVDDDVKFKKDFENTIVEAHKIYKEATIISFMLEDFEGNLFKNYQQVVSHNLESIKDVNSVVISFKKELLLDSDLKFNTNFGLGSTFETADEYILCEMLCNKI